ncbi:hypothetical protein, partial [Acinetobacter sp. LH3_13]|uniref:alpha-L-rhamnosidase-related protein n=1 Tax=Acinetobacter sp. LH3_13 TaxID=3434463 RepID=UPI003EBB8E3F
APTMLGLVESRALLENWLADLDVEQRARGGSVPTTVPDVMPEHEVGAHQAGWADAAAFVPWAVHLAVDDLPLLSAQAASIRSHVA